MEFLKKYDLKPMKVVTFVVLAILAIALLSTFVQFFAEPLDRMANDGSVNQSYSEEVVSSIAPGMDYGAADMGYSAPAAPDFSQRNVMIDPRYPVPGGGYVPGADGESFEVKDYIVTFESGNAEEECAVVLTFKGREDVIFDSSSQFDKGCNYGFKVKKESVDDILALLKDMDPKDVNENTYTVKNLVTDYTSQTDILNAKLVVINETLEKAIAAYDEITELATRTEDADALARIIDGKINVIERLTMERTNIAAQIEELSRAKSEELDRLDYTHFLVSVYEDGLVNGDNLAESWKDAIQQVIVNINVFLMSLTLGLLGLMIVIVQWVVYGAIILIAVKYGWRHGKRFWKQK